MVTRTAFLPGDRDLKILGADNVVAIFSPRSGSPLSGVVGLRTEGGDNVLLSSDYADVEFKFEVFFTSLRRDLAELNCPMLAAKVLQSHCEVKCLFRAEWTRPTMKSETNPKLAQTIRESGRFSRTPQEATAAGLSMIGVALVDSTGAVEAVAIVDDDDPLKLRVIDDSQLIEDLVARCELIAPRDVESWAGTLRDWRIDRQKER